MDTPSVRFDRGTLLLDGVGPDAVPDGFAWDERVGMPRGMALGYRELVASLHRSGLAWHDEARAYSVLDELSHDTAGRRPRAYQAGAVEAWRSAGRRGVVVLPTGAGKSFVAELCIAAARRSTLVVAPTLDLVAQWQRVLERAFGPPIGVFGGGRHELRDITVSTYDSAWMHMDRVGDRFGLVVFDEVHHLPSESYAQCAEMCLAPFRLGLSATPERADEAHLLLDRLVGPVVYRRGIRELAGEVLASYRVVRIEVDLEPDEARAYRAARGTYRAFVRQQRIRVSAPGGWGLFLRAAARSREGRAALRAHRESRRVMHGARAKLDVLEDILADHPEGRVLVFSNDTPTVYRLSRELLVPAITHETGLAERRTILDGFERGRWRVIATARVLNEGVDLPAADVGVVLSGTSTVREHVQRLGRLLRPQAGKKAVLYEVVTAGTAEEAASERRREHDAYR